MTRKILFPSLLTLGVLIGAALAQPAADIATRLARWKTVQMPFHPEGLTPQDRQMVEKLVEACRLLNDVYWRQSDAAGLALYLKTSDPQIKQLLNVNGSRWDLIDSKPFYGTGAQPPGRDLYPHDLTRQQVEQYVAQHPAEKAAIYSGYTVVKRQGDKLIAVPYHEEYRALLTPMAQALRDAAALSTDSAFANFLRLRADALLSDDYYKSDLAWVDLKDPKVDVIFAPYETYLDDLLGVKTSYGASVLIRNEAESRKLAVYQQYVPRIQDALPLDAELDRPSKAGQPTPMEVMDAPYRAGDLRYGYQAVADNLPNDPRIHQEKGTKKIFFKNFMDARVNNVIVPIGKKLLQPAQAAKVTGEGTMAFAVMHEISHGLGPAYSRVNGKQMPITEALGPVYGGLEEAKADVTGMFGLHMLVTQGAMPKERLEEYYASYVGGVFRTLRFGTGEAHGKAMLMEFNVLLESKALSMVSGHYVIDYAKMPDAVAGISKQLLGFEARGDRAGAEAWFAKYGKVPADLQAALDGTKEIPVDVSPVFSFADDLR